MALVLFDNTSGFRPKGKALKWWLMLPQIPITYEGNKIPGVFGNLKSVALHQFLFWLTLILDIALAFQLNEEGVGILPIIGFSAFDIAIALLPILLYQIFDLYPNKIGVNLFINEIQQKIKHKIPTQFNNNPANYQTHLTGEEKKFKWEKKKVLFINVSVVILIMGLAASKFFVYYDVLGADIFIIGIGRFILIVIILSIITHILSTKNVILSWLFFYALKKQKRTFDKSITNEYKIQEDEKNKEESIPFEVPYKSESSRNQFIGKRIDRKQTVSRVDNDGEIISINFKTVTHLNEERYYEMGKFEENTNIYIVHTGLLTDPEISDLYRTQEDSSSCLAVIAKAKEIQLNQN